MDIRIGFIGVGGMATHHINLLAQMEEVKLTAFCDVMPEKAERAALKWGGNSYSHCEEMLDREDLGAVYICLPPFAHGESELAVIERGIPLFVEKPVSNSLATAREIEKAIEGKALLSCVGYNWRYLDTTQKAKELLAGWKIVLMLGFWVGGVPNISWWGSKEKSGGQIVEQATHIYDLARYLAGEVKEVYGIASRGLMEETQSFDIADASTAVLHFASGAIGNISSGCVASQGYAIGLDTICKGMTLKIRLRNLTIEEQGKAITFASSMDSYRLEDESFLQSVRTGDSSSIRSSYDDAVKTLALTLAAEESVQSHRPIALPRGQVD